VSRLPGSVGYKRKGKEENGVYVEMNSEEKRKKLVKRVRESIGKGEWNNLK